MKWLLAIALLAPMEDDVAERFTFGTKTECVTVAQAFVKENLGVQLRDHMGSLEVEPPILRSYMECMPREYESEEDTL